MAEKSGRQFGQGLAGVVHPDRHYIGLHRLFTHHGRCAVGHGLPDKIMAVSRKSFDSHKQSTREHVLGPAGHSVDLGITIGRYLDRIATVGTRF